MRYHKKLNFMKILKLLKDFRKRLCLDRKVNKYVVLYFFTVFKNCSLDISVEFSKQVKLSHSHTLFGSFEVNHAKMAEISNKISFGNVSRTLGIPL
jgi:hypothetical protein